MGTTLTGTTPQDTYDSLIKVTDNGPLSGTAKYLSDGLGNDSALALSTTAVGIGTNAPTQKLQVTSGNILTQGVSGGGAFNILQPITTISDARTWAIGASVAAFGDFAIKQSNAKDGDPITAGDTKFYISNTGNVGIGTSSPAEKLDVIGGALAAGNGTIRTGITYSSLGLLGTFTNHDLGLITNGTEKLRVLAGGGLTFNGDTAAANALDDYEEGTFTATLAPSTSGTITLSVNTCTYTKIGRQVTVKGFLTISSVASPVGTSVDIGGLPFTIINSTSGRGTFSFVVLDASAGYNAFTGATQHTANSTSIIAYYDASTLAASDEIMFTATYFV